MRYPPITCLCPTYGRYEQLRDALAAFELQDYPGQKQLIILNGSSVSLSCANENVRVINQPEHTFPTLGHKRQALLELADTGIVAHWDDDDVYLPWYLSRSVGLLMEHDVGCVRCNGAYYVKGPKHNLDYRGVHHNVFEGTLLFKREEAIERGGYKFVTSGQDRAIIGAFKKADRLHAIKDTEGRISYIYRWSDGLCHISGVGNRDDARDIFTSKNQDNGTTVLTPGDLAPYYRLIPGNKTTTNPQ